MKLRQSHRQSPIALAIASICLLGIESCNHAGYGQREASSLDCAKTTHVKSSAESSSTDAGPPPCGLPVELWHPEWPKSLTATLDRELEPAPPDAITFVLLPDTQYYAHCRYPASAKPGQLDRRAARTKANPDGHHIGRSHGQKYPGGMGILSRRIGTHYPRVSAIADHGQSRPWQ